MTKRPAGEFTRLGSAMKEDPVMRRFSILILLGCVAVTNSCFLLVPRINYDLTASIVGLLGKAHIHEVVGDSYADHHESFWDFGNQRRQLLRVQLSTSKDLVTFANSKGVWISVQWHFCGKSKQEVYLGGNEVFVAGEVVPSIPRRPSPMVADRLGRFSYDAVLYVRGWFMSDETGEIEGEFDLEREPWDVCVQVWLNTKMGGYRTNIARIPAEEVAAALGAKVPSTTAQPSGPQQ